MFNINVEAKGLLRFARYLDEIPKQTNKNLAMALNVAGEGVVRQVAASLSLTTGLSQEMLVSMIRVKKASERDLRWGLDISNVWNATGEKRSFPKRASPVQPVGDRLKEPDQLVKVITIGDEKVCPICDEIKKGGPYTMAEVERLAARLNHFGGGMFHPHCRCGTAPFNPTRRLTLETRGAAAIDSAGVKTMTIKQIAGLLKKQNSVMLTAIKAAKL